MFYLTRDNHNLLVTTHDHNNDPGCKIVTLSDLKAVSRLGKNSVFDTPVEFHKNIKALTFFARPYIELPEKTGIQVYQLQNESGFLVHNLIHKCAYISTSLSRICVQSIIDYEVSILGVIRNELGNQFKPMPIIINNDFTKKKVVQEQLNTDLHRSFDFGWSPNADYFPFGMIVEAQGFKKNTESAYFTKYTGNVLNVGRFTNYTPNDDQPEPVSEIDGEPVELPDEFLYMGTTILHDFIDDNAHTLLVPNVLKASEYNAMIEEMKATGRKRLIYSGPSNNGYGLQAEIVLLDESETTANYLAKVERIVLFASDLILETLPKV